jgi:penicillin V acylase-like amidase (Ntn superfamily)
VNGKLPLILIATALICLLAGAAAACTSFCFQHGGQWVFGKNFDWMVENGMFVVNKRGVAKQSFSSDNPATWVSKYGSVTVNQYGREMPMGGMNEAGLVVENMWLDETEYPAPDHRASLQELQWIQYHLDTAASVEDVVASDSIVRIDVASQPLHFLVCDSNGGCASLEFLGGRTVIHSGESLPITALTNNPYDQSISFVAGVAGDDAQEAFADADYSLKRFYWAAVGVRGYQEGGADSPVEHAFSILEKASVSRTQWRIVYDAANQQIHYRTRSAPTVKHFDVGAFDYGCETPVKILDLQAPVTGDATSSFAEYSYEANLRLIRSAFGGTEFLRDTPDDVLQRLAAAPETMPRHH